MRWKTTLALLLVTAGIGAYISLYEIRQPSSDERRQQAKRVLTIEESAVAQLTLDMPQTKLTFTRSGPEWRIVPTGARADAARLTTLLTRLRTLTANRILTATPEHPLDLKRLGLQPAVGSVEALAQGTPITLLIGNATPVKGHRYAKVTGGAEVFVIAEGLFDDANQPTERFRDPLLIRVDPWQTAEVRLTTSDYTIALTHHGDGEAWQITQPLSDRAEGAAVTGLLNRLGELTIKRFVDDAPQVEQLSTWGFDHPQMDITVQPRGSAAHPVTIFFGQPLPDDASLRYAKRYDEPGLYAVAAAEVDALRLPLDDVRLKSGFEIVTSQVTKIEVKREGAAWTMANVNGSWQVDGADHTILDAPRVEEFLEQVAALRVDGFVEEARADPSREGLEPQANVLSIWTSKPPAPPQRLIVGAALTGSAQRYGRIEGRAATVILPGTVSDLLATTPERLRAPASAAPAQARATSSPARPHPAASNSR